MIEEGATEKQSEPPTWRLVAASVAGFSHQEKGLVCQDAHASTVTSEGWLVAVIADGAGSTDHGGEGAAFICGELVEAMIHAVPVEPPASELGSVLTDAIDHARGMLAEVGDLKSYASTLLGCVAGPAGGVFFHIGDGIGIATIPGAWDRYVLSPPENGEYANETYFFTDGDWREHLRFTPFGAEFTLITLSSDGVAPFALEPGHRGLYPPFIAPLHEFFVGNDPATAQAGLIEILQRDQIRPITGDDKTLLWAYRQVQNERRAVPNR